MNSAVTEWQFEVVGPPVAKQRPRRAPDGHWYTPTRTISYEMAVAGSARAAGVHLEPERDYGLEITFYLSTRRRDIDNLMKTVLDGLQRLGGGWNDRQVVNLVGKVVSVVDGGDERAVVRVYECGQAGGADTGPIDTGLSAGGAKRVGPRLGGHSRPRD